MKTKHHITIGDSRNMNNIDDGSIHLIITSPPYWQLKDYGDKRQIGYDDTYEQYINNLNIVWQQCYRVLHSGCRLCINIGDQFARSVYYGRYKIIPIREEIIRFCETIGFDFMGSIIWQKVTTCNTTGGATIMGSYPYPRNGIIKIDYEYILLFKKPGDGPKIPKEEKEKARLTTEEWNEYFSGHWYFPGIRQDKHLAMYPEELPKRLIRMFSFEGENVLDPFLGSGTTSLAARKLSRNSYGFELNEGFEQLILDKLNSETTLFDEYEVDIVKRQDELDLDKMMSNLPYRFEDPVRIEKRMDPKDAKFGSKIDISDNNKKQESFGVKSVISPDLLMLKNGEKIRLIGIKAVPEKYKDAVKLLEDMLNGKRVQLKYDEKLKYDNDNNEYAYVYLTNKTFINMRLIKSGFVVPDEGIDYEKKDRFIKTGGQING